MIKELLDWALQYGVAENQTAAPTVANLQVTPNPFAHNAKIRYMIHDPGSTIDNSTIAIYDAAGRLVKSFNLETGTENQGLIISWYGDDNTGKKLPAGVYFLKLRAGDNSATEKLLLIR